MKMWMTVVTITFSAKTQIVMRKLFLLLASVVVIAVSFSSCQKDKEESITRFTAKMENCADQQDNKTFLDGTKLKWVVGDRVKVYGQGGNGASCRVSSTDETGTYATLDYVSGQLGFTPYKAIYPENCAISKTTIVLPSVQWSNSGNLVDFPMYSESSTNEFRFKNLCGVLKIHLQQANVTISKIKVIADNICGTFTIQGSSEQPIANYSSNGHNTVTLALTNYQNITNGQDFYVCLPAGTYSTMQLNIYSSNGQYCTKSGHNISVERSKYSTIRVTNMEFNEVDIQEGRLPGLFSVANNRQVYFSQGNLQYSNLGTHSVFGHQTMPGTWRFAESQWDMIGNGNSNISESYTGWIDLFGWGTSGWNNGNYNYMPYSSDDSWDGIEVGYGYGPFDGSSAYYDLTGAYANSDWGVYNAISNGGDIPGLWRTLSKEECEYLLFLRPNATNLNVTATVNGIHGLIILPDNWTTPSAINLTLSGSWNNNVYTISQWNIMEQAGAVFLPASLRIGSYVGGYDGYYGYWTSSKGDASDYPSKDAYMLTFTESRVVNYSIENYESIRQGHDRYVGLPVRLVQDK